MIRTTAGFLCLVLLTACQTARVPQGAAPIKIRNHKVSGDAHTVTTATVATVDNPKITITRYVVRGEVRYSKVDPAGYLEMWSNFADGGRYFSRTLTATGPTAALSGSSAWRPFELPFSTWTDYMPTRLEINVVLPRRGTVEVRNLGLVQVRATE